jgi:hypothetical protein
VVPFDNSPREIKGNLQISQVPQLFGTNLPDMVRWAKAVLARRDSRDTIEVWEIGEKLVAEISAEQGNN